MKGFQREEAIPGKIDLTRRSLKKKQMGHNTPEVCHQDGSPTSQIRRQEVEPLHNNRTSTRNYREAISSNDRLLELPCGSGVRDQPTPNAFGDLSRSGFWHFVRVLAVPADPIRSSRRLLHEFNAVRRPTAHFQADADVRR